MKGRLLMQPPRVTVYLTKVKETKNTVRYEDGSDGALISTLYVAKSAGDLGESIRLTVDPVTS
jgi:hypothetical protein